jgi:hypothetical protein
VNARTQKKTGTRKRSSVRGCLREPRKDLIGDKTLIKLYLYALINVPIRFNVGTCVTIRSGKPLKTVAGNKSLYSAAV